MAKARVSRAKPNAARVKRRLFGIVTDPEADVKDIIAAARVLLQCGDLGAQSDVHKAAELNAAIDRIATASGMTDEDPPKSP